MPSSFFCFLRSILLLSLILLSNHVQAGEQQLRQILTATFPAAEREAAFRDFLRARGNKIPSDFIRLGFLDQSTTAVEALEPVVRQTVRYSSVALSCAAGSGRELVDAAGLSATRYAIASQLACAALRFDGHPPEAIDCGVLGSEDSFTIICHGTNGEVVLRLFFVDFVDTTRYTFAVFRHYRAVLDTKVVVGRFRKGADPALEAVWVASLS